MPERQLDPPEGELIPEPYSLMFKMRHGNPKLYKELMMDEIEDRAERLLNAYVKSPNAVIEVLDDCSWYAGDTEMALDWWRDIQ